jgi:hypothetical protein
MQAESIVSLLIVSPTSCSPWLSHNELCVVTKEDSTRVKKSEKELPTSCQDHHTSFPPSSILIPLNESNDLRLSSRRDDQDDDLSELSSDDEPNNIETDCTAHQLQCRSGDTESTESNKVYVLPEGRPLTRPSSLVKFLRDPPSKKLHLIKPKLRQSRAVKMATNKHFRSSRSLFIILE